MQCCSHLLCLLDLSCHAVMLVIFNPFRMKRNCETPWEKLCLFCTLGTRSVPALSPVSALSCLGSLLLCCLTSCISTICSLVLLIFNANNANLLLLSWRIRSSSGWSMNIWPVISPLLSVRNSGWLSSHCVHPDSSKCYPVIFSHVDDLSVHLFVPRGDFRSGKRLNMRRIIPYIASNFQNDRIWLRRSKPSRRDYQILLAVDDSSSMRENNSHLVSWWVKAHAVLDARGLTDFIRWRTSLLLSLARPCIDWTVGNLESVGMSAVKHSHGRHHLHYLLRFGEDTEVLLPLDQPFSGSQGAHLLHHLTFTQTKTNFVNVREGCG